MQEWKDEMKTMHLFAGAGGGLLCDLILGHKPIVAVEWDAYCCRVLRERAADGWFPSLHVWEGDVRLFDPSEYAGRVEVVHAGFPCTDISRAGNQAGVGEGTRSGLYREVLRIADIVRPRYLYLENVSAILANEFLGTVLGDLAARGYDARWTCLPASAAGAPHYRDRWWCIAERADAECVHSSERRGFEEVRRRSDEAKQARLVGGYVPDTNGERELQPEGCEPEQRGWSGDVGEDVAYPPNKRFHKRRRSSRACKEVRFIRRNGRDGLPGLGQEKAQLLAHAMLLRQQGEQSTSPYAQECPQSGERPAGSCGIRGRWWDAESGVGLLVNGLASDVVQRCEKVNEEETRPDQTLHPVWCADDSQTLQRTPRGHAGIPPQKVLQPVMREHSKGFDKARVFVEGPEAPKGQVRGVRVRKEASGSSHRSGQHEQRPAEYPDTLQALPRFLAHDTKKKREGSSRKDAMFGWWELEPDVGRVAARIPNRAHRIKALGNAQVPLQAALAWMMLGGPCENQS